MNIFEDWYKGLLFAEEQYKRGWAFKGINNVEEYAIWNLEGTEGVQLAFGESGWLDGVRDYYKNRNENVIRFCEGK